MCEWCFGFLFKPTLRKPVSNSNSFPNLFAQGGGSGGGGILSMIVHGQDNVIHERQDSMKCITYNKSVRMVFSHGLEGRFSCVAEEDVSMFVVSKGLKNMIRQLLDTGEHMVGCRCLTYMDHMRSTITEYVCQDGWISCKFLGKRWCDRAELL